MDQVESLKETVIQKNKEIEGLRNLIKAGAGVTTEKTALEKCLWGMVFSLLEKHVPCEKCGNTTRPLALKTGYVVARCHICGHLMDLKRKKGVAFSAYFDKFRRR